MSEPQDLKDLKDETVDPSLDDSQSEDEIVTMMDVIKADESLEQESDAVYGAADDTKCTYDEGYKRRQPLFSCLTCAEKTDNYEAGMCLACSLSCHDGHQLVELYTKRNFRCDCGVKGKFDAGTPCSLIPVKEDNPDNKYSHNFKNQYCICNRPYPDPEDTVPDIMIQCILCEDWFHKKHLEGGVGIGDQDYEEMICHVCVGKSPFLMFYQEVSTEPQAKRVCLRSGDDDEDKDKVESVEKNEVKVNETSSNGEPDVPTSQGSESKEQVDLKSDCKLERAKKQNAESGAMKKGSLFLESGWRNKLCLCNSCLDMYRVHNMSFLPQEEDTILFYEKEGQVRTQRERCGSSSSIDRGMNAFNELPRNQKVELLQGYDALQTALKDFLKGFAESGKVVNSEDIQQFFEDFKKEQANKPGVNSLGSNCR